MEGEQNIPSSGENLERVHLNQLVNGVCPNCNKNPILICERVLIEGSLENYHLVHTEVEDFYQCPNCKHSWRKFQYL